MGDPTSQYTDVDSVKSELELGSSDAFPDTFDGLLGSMIEHASRLIDSHKRIEPGAYKTNDVTNDETRYYFGSGQRIQPIDFVVAITTVSVEETDGTYTVWTADTDFYTKPYNAALIREPIRWLEIPAKSGSTKSVWTFGPKRVEVIGKFGVSAIPPGDIARATMIQCQRWYQRALQGWQDTGAIPELGQLRFTKQLDPDVKQLISSAFPHISRAAL